MHHNLPGSEVCSLFRVSGHHGDWKTDVLAIEQPLRISIENGDEWITMRTPGQDQDLVTGALFSEYRIRQVEDIREWREFIPSDAQESGIRVILDPNIACPSAPFRSITQSWANSACGVCGKTQWKTPDIERAVPESLHPWLDPSILFHFPGAIRQSQGLFSLTGGWHASALFDEHGKLLLLREDIGRHNAMDKLIGASLRCNLLPWRGKIVMLSGRASYELVQKAASAGAEIVCAISAPSSLAVSSAQDFGITLIGFLNNKTFNVYSFPQRLAVAMTAVDGSHQSYPG